MRDRIPTPGKENRVKITLDDGTVIEGAMEYADDAIQEGSIYTKGNVLPDNVCDILNLDRVTSEPKDAWLAIMYALGYSSLLVRVRNVSGDPVANTKVAGITGIVDEKTYTDDTGNLFVLIKEGTYTLSIPELSGCIDADLESKQVVVVSGTESVVDFQPTPNGKTSESVSATQKVKFSDNISTVDVFCVGGGGGGGGGASNLDIRDYRGAGGGGGGGYTSTAKNVPFESYTEYDAVVGSGGTGGNGVSTDQGYPAFSGNSGGKTSFLGVEANGGAGGRGGSFTYVNGDYGGKGGDGGSGGGGGGTNYSSAMYAAGGSDGGDGKASADSYGGPGGKGQGTTTRAFGEPSGELYSEGGDGGTGNSGGYPSRRGDGGGGGAIQAGKGANGNPGIILIRWTTKI